MTEKQFEEGGYCWLFEEAVEMLERVEYALCGGLHDDLRTRYIRFREKLAILNAKEDENDFS